MTEIQTQVRCAVYTRKSTDEGLDMQFNSLDAQREAGEAFIASQKAKGWVQFPKKGNCQIRQPIKKKTGMALVFFYFSFMVC